MGLRRRITIPFLALFLIVSGTMTLLSARLVGDAVERRFQSQADDLARMMSSRGFPLNHQSLSYIREAYGADVTVMQGHSVVDSTGLPSHEETMTMCAPLDLRERGSARLMLHFPREIVDRERAAAVRPVLAVGAIATVLAMLLGLAIAHKTARPLERLAARVEQRGESPIPRVGGGREIDQLVDALNRMAEEIRKAEQFGVMGRMAAAVAHEIKNPLYAMKMNVQMLLETAADREPYHLLLREIERLELAAAELGGRTEKLTKESVPLARLVDDVLELLKLQLNHLHIAVEKQYERDDRIGVDVARFKRAVMNLLLNGAQAMPGGGTLTVAVRTLDRGAVRLSVSDTGAGIPSDLRPRIFEPFVTTKRDGVGLGLVLTKGIVEEHGGSIAFETSDRGTTFSVDLPRHG